MIVGAIFSFFWWELSAKQGDGVDGSLFTLFWSCFRSSWAPSRRRRRWWLCIHIVLVVFQEQLSTEQKETALVALYSHCFGRVSGAAEHRAEGDGVGGSVFTLYWLCFRRSWAPSRRRRRCEWCRHFLRLRDTHISLVVSWSARRWATECYLNGLFTQNLNGKWDGNGTKLTCTTLWGRLATGAAPVQITRGPTPSLGTTSALCDETIWGNYVVAFCSPAQETGMYYVRVLRLSYLLPYFVVPNEEIPGLRGGSLFRPSDRRITCKVSLTTMISSHSCS